MGSDMSDEVLRSVLKDEDPDVVHGSGRRGTATMFSRLAEIFVEDGKPKQVVDLDLLAKTEKTEKKRAFGAVAQSLRNALRDTVNSDGQPLSSVAHVSVDMDNQIITLVRRSPAEVAKWILEEPVRKQRAAKANAKKAKNKTDAAKRAAEEAAGE